MTFRVNDKRLDFLNPFKPGQRLSLATKCTSVWGSLDYFERQFELSKLALAVYNKEKVKWLDLFGSKPHLTSEIIVGLRDLSCMYNIVLSSVIFKA